MPRTRNVARSQWDTANTSNNSTRNRNQNENNNDENEKEKENIGRQGSRTTRSHARTGGRTGLLGASNIVVLGATTTSKVKGEKATKLKTASKGKGVPPAAPLKRKKQPLQDITAEFLPAPEAANRGEDALAEDIDNGTGSQTNANVVVATMPPPETTSVIVPPTHKFTSPLPPSSPPSELTVSPSRRPVSSAPKLLDNFYYSSTYSIPQEPYDPWQEFDDARLASQDSAGKVSSNSDPFGFVSLERKLKVERETAAMLASEQGHEDAALVLVADTSSPRPVRRLKRSLQDETELPESVEEAHDRPHYITPPTPHKDKQKRRRMSHEGHDVFSSCSSSVESSPSPSKASARKRTQPTMLDDPLDRYNKELDQSYEQEMASKGTKAGPSKIEVINVDPDAVSRNLRSREKHRLHVEIEAEEDRSENQSSKKVVKGKSVKKSVSKSRSTTKKNAAKDEASDAEHEDLDEKWERERQERVDYFKRLEAYEVEKEDVFLI